MGHHEFYTASFQLKGVAYLPNGRGSAGGEGPPRLVHFPGHMVRINSRVQLIAFGDFLLIKPIFIGKYFSARKTANRDNTPKPQNPKI